MSNEALVKTQQNTALVPSDGFLEGLEDVQLKPSTMILVQNTTNIEGVDTEGKAGKFLVKSSGQTFDELRVVPLAFRRTRVLWTPGAEFGADPLCRSNDGITPSPFVENPQHEQCKGCPRANWDIYWKSGKKQKPDCQEKVQFLFLERETQLPYQISVSGKGIKPFMEMMGEIKRIAISRAKATPSELLNIYDFSFTVKSVKVKNAKGVFFVLNFSDLKKVQNIGEFSPLFQQFVKARKQEEAELDQEIQRDDAAGDLVEA